VVQTTTMGPLSTASMLLAPQNSVRSVSAIRASASAGVAAYRETIPTFQPLQSRPFGKAQDRE
ncbi:MAG: hypothetical protein WDO73_09075, partial [Ignavibacteriota bacterium]